MSLDTFAILAKEFGADGIHSNELRDIAREIIKEFAVEGVSWERCEWAMRKRLPDIFLDRITSQLGNDTSTAVERWAGEFFDHETPLTDCHWGMIKLIKEWNRLEDISDLPINAPEHAVYRLMIRDSYSHIQNVNNEIYFRLIRSEWDGWLHGIINEEDELTIHLSGSLQEWCEWKLWKEITRQLPGELVDSLLAYIQEQEDTE
jgi:hypothetical protein